MKVTHTYIEENDEFLYQCANTGVTVSVKVWELSGLKSTEQLMSMLTDRGLFDAKNNYPKNENCDSTFNRAQAGVWYRNPRNGRSIFVALEKLRDNAGWISAQALTEILTNAGMFRMIEVVKVD